MFYTGHNFIESRGCHITYHVNAGLVREYYYTMVFQLLLNVKSTLSVSGLSIVALVWSISNPSFYISSISKNLVSMYVYGKWLVYSI